MIVVSDTSVLNYFLQIGGENLLILLFSKIVIPPTVRLEMAGSPAFFRFQKLLDEQIIFVEEITDKSFFYQLRQSLDAGEAEAIVLAKELNANYLLVDERLADTIAKTYGIPTIGVLGILIEAKKFGHISLVQPYLNQLTLLTNFRISKQLYQSVLSMAGE